MTLCIAILCTAGCSSGAEKKDTSKEMIEKTITFTTKGTKRDANHNFDAIIQKDGKTYELQNVDYDLLNSKEYTKEFTKTVESDILSPEQSYTPDSEIVENEITYQEEMMNWDNVTIFSSDLMRCKKTLGILLENNPD